MARFTTDALWAMAPRVFDVIVIGLGHAGCEAALACARMGLQTAGVTLRVDRAAVMSCNPAVGGTAKGHLVRELDALGGEMGRAADQAGTHFVTLNASKGPAVRATRVLCDREAYAVTMQQTLKGQPGLTLVEGEVESLVAEASVMRGVRLRDGRVLEAPAVVVTTGTFLQALMHRGQTQEVGGRLGDAAATGLSKSLSSLGIELRRFKTGTPARLLARSIDWARCQKQPSEPDPRPFSLRTPRTGFPSQRLLDCFVTHTNPTTHQIVGQNLQRSALYCGTLVGRGPRYCPSFEDKVVRFAGKARHTVFLEPEGYDSPLVYPAGLSTSLPEDVQLAFLRSIEGLEAVEVERFGYAVEYDYSPPTQLRPTLETKQVKGLFFAGQLNGTSGYEEAAFQGLMAGINAGLAVHQRPPLVLGRHEAHGAVLIDELVSKGVDEPFRMLTSRSEHRLTLREGNAALRLRPRGAQVGLVSTEEAQQTEAQRVAIEAELTRLEQAKLAPLLRRPGTRYSDVAANSELPVEVVDEVETRIKYAGYVAQAQASLERGRDAFDTLVISEDFDFRRIAGLGREAQERLSTARPMTFGHAKALPGLTPAALTLLLANLRREA